MSARLLWRGRYGFRRLHLFRGDRLQGVSSTSLLQYGTYLIGWHLLDLLVKDRLDAFPHLRDRMIWTIEKQGVGEHEPDVGHKFLGGEVSRIVRVGVWFLRIRGGELPVDRLKVHRVFDDVGVVRDVEGDGVDGIEEGDGVLEFAKVANGRDAESELGDGEGRSPVWIWGGSWGASDGGGGRRWGRKDGGGLVRALTWGR